MWGSTVILMISSCVLINGMPINEKLVKEAKVIDGDIMVSEQESAQLPENAHLKSYINEVYSGPDGGSVRWPNNIMPYTFSGRIDGDGRSKIKAALRELQQKSCFKFVEKKSGHHSYIVFDDDGGACRSFAGRQGGRQTIYLQKNCVNERWTIQHEVFHALGFIHEHQRSDRDNYITVWYNNMVDGSAGQMEKHQRGLLDLSLPYDTYSIMHYFGRVFAKFDSGSGNYMVTMTMNSNGQEVPNNTRLTNLDIKKLKRLGNCPEPSKRKQTNKRKKQG